MSGIEDLHEYDNKLEVLIKYLFRDLDLHLESNIRALERITTHTYKLRHLSEEAKTVLALKKEGHSAECIASRFTMPIEKVFLLEKNLIQEINRTREQSHVRRKIPIALFYSQEDMIAIHQKFVRQTSPEKRPIITYEELMAEAEQRYLSDENSFQALVNYLHGEGCAIVGTDNLRLIPQELPVTIELHRTGETRLRSDVGVWDLRMDLVIHWNEGTPENEYDKQHQALFRKHLKMDAFMEIVYAMRKQGLNGMQMAEKLEKDPIDVYTAESQIWHLYKASFPVK